MPQHYWNFPGTSAATGDGIRELTSVYEAALESTADALLVVDLHGRVVGFNRNFLQAWGIPEPLAEARDDRALIAFVVDQLADPAAFLARVEEIYAEPSLVTFDVLDFKDGRVFERYSRPEFVDQIVVGRVWSFRDATERRRAARQLQDSERWLRQVIDLMPQLVFAKDEDGRFIMVNQPAAQALGCTVDDAIGKLDRELSSGTGQVDRFLAEDRQVIESGMPLRIPETESLDAYGNVRWAETIKFPVKVLGSDRPGVLVVVSDTTERRLLEQELRQSQKMEAVGRLAGGIAHDFNNLLTAILGFSTSVLGGFAAEDPRRRDLEEVVSAARRAADLTRQLLAFSRRQVLRPRVIDLNAVVTDLARLLGRVLGEDVKVALALDQAPVPILADRGQIEQVLLNLAVNAREALPGGGSLSIETALVEAGARPGTSPDRPGGGPWVRLRVRDNGIGIPADELGRIFEPFYTTKENGTGLGLAVVYGIVEQSGGWIEVSSTVGRGTSVEVMLPRSVEAVEQDPPEPLISHGAGPATILLAEDEDAVRRFVGKLLGLDGYRVLEAANGEAALRIAAEWAGPIDLLLTDLVMPGMNGRELGAELRTRRPGLKLIYMSGYAGGTLGRGNPPDPALTFLQKPFDSNELLDLVRATLANPIPA